MTTFNERRIAALQHSMEARLPMIAQRRFEVNTAISLQRWSEAEQAAEELHRLVRDQNTAENILADLLP